MAIMSISVLPVGTSSTSMSRHVAKAVKAARDAGFEAEVTAMGTVVSGDVDELLSLAADMHKSVLSGGVKRCVTVISIDDRKDKVLSISGKVKAVEKRLGASKPRTRGRRRA